MADSDAITRGRLIEATQQLLANGGVAALTSRSIASTADANLASITYYFGSKAQLVTESILLLRRILSDHRDDLSAYLQIIAIAPTSPSISDVPQSAANSDSYSSQREPVRHRRSAALFENERVKELATKERVALHLG